MKMYELMTVPTLLYGSEIWVPIQNDLNKIELAEIKVLGIVKGSTVLHKINNEEIRKELEIELKKNE